MKVSSVKRLSVESMDLVLSLGREVATVMVVTFSVNEN